MGRKVIYDKINRQEFHAKITMDMILDMRDRIAFDSLVEHQEGDKRKISDYTCQDLWNYCQSMVKDINI